MRNWISNPAWGPIGVFVGILSLLPPAPTFTKTLIFIVILAASIYVFYSSLERRRSAKSKFTQGQLDDNPPSPARYSQNAPFTQQAQPPSPTMSEAPNTSVPMPEYTLKDRFFSFIVMAIILGLPGVLLVRSGVSWQHIIGIVLLIFFGFVTIMTFIGPEGADALEKYADRQDRMALRYMRLASRLSETSDTPEKKQD
jgi:hypothetical protein